MFFSSKKMKIQDGAEVRLQDSMSSLPDRTLFYCVALPGTHIYGWSSSRPSPQSFPKN
jgi:hypothetical protein